MEPWQVFAAFLAIVGPLGFYVAWKRRGKKDEWI